MRRRRKEPDSNSERVSGSDVEHRDRAGASRVEVGAGRQKMVEAGASEGTWAGTGPGTNAIGQENGQESLYQVGNTLSSPEFGVKSIIPESLHSLAVIKQL